MYTRLYKPPVKKSFFLFGPRGTGKTTYLRSELNADVRIDLLNSLYYQPLLAAPHRLSDYITSPHPKLIVIDEIQKVPSLLDEVHRLIEEKKWVFALTGSSARKLKTKGTNLLAGRAITTSFYPLTTLEIGNDFNILNSLKWGHLPSVFSEHNKTAYLKTYIGTYLREEVQQEGLTRNIAAFSRFIEAASFSQGSILNISAVARDSNVDRKMVEIYFSILEDLLIGVRLPSFQKKAKRRVVAHPKFYYFDVGVFRAIRPQGPLEDASSINGIALETLVFQELRALNDLLGWGMELYYWRSQLGQEVDFVLYGDKGIYGIEVKLSKKVRPNDVAGLRAFKEDYPKSKLLLLYTGEIVQKVKDIDFIPVQRFLRNPEDFLGFEK